MQFWETQTDQLKRSTDHSGLVVLIMPKKLLVFLFHPRPVLQVFVD